MLIFAPNQKSFLANSDEDNTQSLADYMLDDILHQAKNISGSNFRKLLESISKEITRYEQDVQNLVDDYYPAFTNNLIEQWERALGIPDECFKLDHTFTVEFRRKQVIAKLALMNATTKEDFIALAAFFGVNVTILNGTTEFQNGFAYTFPFRLGGNGKTSKFTILVIFEDFDEPSNAFPMTFPITFEGNAIINLIKCLFEKMKPVPYIIRFLFRK